MHICFWYNEKNKYSQGFGVGKMTPIIRISFFFWLGCTIWGGILNGGFEIPDPNTTEWFIPPWGWARAVDNPYRDCYAGLHRYLVPNPQYDRSKREVHWTLPEPYEGRRFVVLSTGDLGDDSDPAIIHSTITQTVTFLPGQRLSGAYFFGTCDFLQYNDYGKIYLVPEDPNSGLPSEIVLAYCDVMQVGDFQSTNTWIPFQYDFTEETAGTYRLICTVRDQLDTIYKSYLAVDGLSVCTVQPGDINHDCSVDSEDFQILSQAWLSWCPDLNAFDPNTLLPKPDYPGGTLPPGTVYDPNLIDPNCPCPQADLNKDWFVDTLDLIILTDNWLKNGQ